MNNTLNFPYTRINVIGTSGSGKTTFAAAIAQRLNIPHIEFDSLYWGPNWQDSSDEEFFQKAAALFSEDAWVSDGNYTRFRSLTWKNVQLVVWLDFPFLLVFWRVFKRTLLRAFFKEELWSGNRESLSMAFFTKDSILWWVITSYKRRKRNTIANMNDPQYAHIKFVRLTSPRQAQKWLDELVD